MCMCIPTNIWAVDIPVGLCYVLTSDLLSLCDCLLLMSADGSAFTDWWRMLVSKSNGQDTGRQTVGPALGAPKVSAARLSRPCQFLLDPLCWACRLLLWSVAAQEHGPTQWECSISAPGLSQWLHAYHLERWYVRCWFSDFIVCFSSEVIILLISSMLV